MVGRNTVLGEKKKLKPSEKSLAHKGASCGYDPDSAWTLCD